MSVTWDRWGVPTIEGQDELEVVYGVGYAQACAHATEVLALYGVARGNAAACWGESFVAEDVLHRQLGLGALVNEWWRVQPDQTRARLQAFADGFNAACEEDTRRGTTRREALPVTARDVVAHAVRVFVRFSTMDPLGLAFAPEALAQAGSNAWAVSAERSSTGEATLVINPHLRWSGFHRFFEVRTLSPERSFHGIALVGMPWQSMGYGPTMGWAHTVNPIPLMSVYALEVDGDRYRHDDAWLSLEVREHRVEVQGADAITVQERRSVHGPVVTAPDGAEVAVRVAGVLHEPTTRALEAWWQMSLARDVRELLDTVDELPIPMFNVVAADATGSVGAAYCGTPFVRDGGTFDDNQRRLPGDDPSLVWDKVHTPAELPRVIDPACGWVQNVNEAPWWFCDPPLDHLAHPAYVAPPPEAFTGFRSVRSRSYLTACDALGPEELLELKWDTSVPLAGVVLDQLLEAAKVHADLQEAVAVLASWDRTAATGSRGYPLFLMWLWSNAPAIRAGMFFLPAPPGGAPQGLADVPSAVEALRTACTLMQVLETPLDAALSDIAEMREREHSVPADGGSSQLGVLKALEVVPGARPWEAVFGDTWVALVRFGSDGPQAQALLVYGNATEPTAPTADPQVGLFAANRLRHLERLATPTSSPSR